MESQGQLQDFTAWKENVGQLENFLRANHPDNVIMPLRSKEKCPAYPHKGGKWTWQDFDTWMQGVRVPTDVGILLRGLVVLDADSEERVQKLELKYPALTTCPCVETRKGKHYYFLRTSLCDELGMTDTPGILDKLDFKTVTASYVDNSSGNPIATAGVIVVPPSTNKTWVRSIVETPLIPIPDEIVQYLSTQKKGKRGGSVSHSNPKNVPENVPLGDEKLMVEKAEELLAAMGDSTSSFAESQWLSGDIFSVSFRNGPQGRRCPSDEFHTSNNFYVHCHLDGTCWYRCLASECRQRMFIGRWKEAKFMFVEDGLDLLKMALKPCRFQDDDGALASAVKGCYGKKSLPVFKKLMAGQGRSDACLENIFDRSKMGAPDRLLHWAYEDSPELESSLKEYNIGPPSFDDTSAARAFHDYMLHHFGYKFVYCNERARFFWDGAQFHCDNDDAHTKNLAEKHGAAIAAAFNVSPKMYSNSRDFKGVCAVLDAKTLDRGVYQQMNANKGLLGFNNGVLVLETGEFRPAKFEDFISMSVGYDYHTERNREKEAEVLNFFEQVFPDEEIREFVLGRLASCLEGGNEEEKGPAWTGASGANGKSKTAELMCLVLGEYAGSMESSQFTTTRSAAGANSQLASRMFCRFVVIEEPDTAGGAIFNWSFYKELTGRGAIQVRNLYEKATISMQPHFTPFFLFNSLPEGSKTIDKAVQRRMEMVPFESEFTEDPTLPHQVPIDVSLSRKFPEWKQHLFNIMYHDYYRPYVEGGRKLKQPQKCKDTMHAILDAGNVVKAWFEERVVLKENGVLTLSAVKDDFYHYWIPESGRSTKGIKSAELKKQLESLLNAPPTEQLNNKKTGNVNLHNVWEGYALKPRDRSL